MDAPRLLNDPDRAPGSRSRASAGRTPRRDVHFALESAAPTVVLECEVHVWAPGASGVAGWAGVAARGIAGALVTAAAQAAAAPRRGPWWRRLSESVAKTRVAPKRARRNVDIPRFFSRPIPARSAFATDLDTSPSQTVPGAPPAPLRVSPSAWCHRWRRGAPAQRFRGSAGGPPNREGYSGVALKAWGVKVVVTVCSGGPSSSEGLLRRRPGASAGVMRGARGRP